MCQLLSFPFCPHLAGVNIPERVLQQHNWQYKMMSCGHGSDQISVSYSCLCSHYISFSFLRLQTLKRKEKEYEHEMERLAREKIATQQRLAELKNELSQWMDVLEIDRIIRQTVQPEDDQASTSTASGTHNCSLFFVIILECH